MVEMMSYQIHVEELMYEQKDFQSYQVTTSNIYIYPQTIYKVFLSSRPSLTAAG